jgi:hypothetical protein
VDKEQINYNETTGIGFFSTSDGLRWCFKKEPYQRSIGPLNDITGAAAKRHKQSADKILEELNV